MFRIKKYHCSVCMSFSANYRHLKIFGKLTCKAKQQLSQTSMEIPTVALHSTSDHLSIPVIGMGTAVARQNYDLATIKEAIVEAIKAGYRHFDTAGLYKSEPYLGEALAEALTHGLVSRDQLFITTKLWSADAHPGLVIPALKRSLQYFLSSTYLILLYM